METNATLFSNIIGESPALLNALTRTEFFDRPFREAMKLFEAAYFKALLDRSGGNMSRAAELALGARCCIRI